MVHAEEAPTACAAVIMWVSEASHEISLTMRARVWNMKPVPSGGPTEPSHDMRDERGEQTPSLGQKINGGDCQALDLVYHHRARERDIDIHRPAEYENAV